MHICKSVDLCYKVVKWPSRVTRDYICRELLEFYDIMLRPVYSLGKVFKGEYVSWITNYTASALQESPVNSPDIVLLQTQP